MTSLRGQLAFFWLLLAVVCAGLAVMMVVLFRTSAGAQIAQARGATEHSCDAIARRYGEVATEPPRDELFPVVLHLVLIEAPHVEGGVWRAVDGFVAYAYPTYEGGGVKRDVPDAEKALIEQMARRAIQARASQTDVLRGAHEALILTACPLRASTHDVAAWTMTRVPALAEAAQRSLRVGLAALLGFVLASGLWLGSILARGHRHVRDLEDALARADAHADAAPVLARTGVDELDRLVDSFNRYGRRLEAAQAQLREVRRRQARDQRLAALGRMTGSIAHEIRNPIATMRLRVENALVAPAERHGDALRMILQQTARLDVLVQNLLALVQPLALHPEPVDVCAWLDERVAAAEARASLRGVRLDVVCELETAVFDRVHLARALDNLVDNAVRHAPEGSAVTVTAARTGGERWTLAVDDAGPGVSAELRENLFEPFATGRAGGTGLGLALAREVADAHGGELRYEPRANGSRFAIELPWHTC